MQKTERISRVRGSGRARARIVLGLGAALTLAPGAAGQLALDPASLEPADGETLREGEEAMRPEGHRPWQAPPLPTWRLRFSPRAYYVAPEGDLTYPGSPGGGPSRLVGLTSLNLDSPELEPFGTFEVARDRIRFTLSGFGFSNERSTITPLVGQLGELTVFEGERLETDLEYQTFEGTLSYRVLGFARGAVETIGEDRAVSTVMAGVDLLGGVRFQRFSSETEVIVQSGARDALPAGAPLGTEVDEFFAEPLLGARFELMLWNRMTINVRGSAGFIDFGDRQASSFDIDASFAFRIIDEAQLLVGYRLLTTNLEDGEGFDRFEFDGEFAGLYFGLQAAF